MTQLHYAAHRSGEGKLQEEYGSVMIRLDRVIPGSGVSPKIWQPDGYLQSAKYVVVHIKLVKEGQLI